MTIQSPALQSNKTKKGFTLTEIAIVLGIIGLILGAVWVAASGVYSNQKVSKANTEILTILQSVRTLYSTSATTGLADATDMTADLCSAQAFPGDMLKTTTCSATNVNNPWGGNTTVLSSSSSVAGTGDALVVRMTAVPTAACISLFTSIAGNSRDSGLWYVGVPAYTVGTNTFAGLASPPVTVSAAAGATQCSAGATNTITLTFKLKG